MYPGLRLRLGLRLRWLVLLAALVFIQSASAGTSGRNNPLDPDGNPATNDVLYYYDYSDDGITGPQLIHDKTNNTSDTTAPIYTSDDLVTSLVEEGNPANNPFVFDSGAGTDFLLPGARVWDVATTGNGGLTATQNILTHQDISDFGGFTFETYLKRTAETIGTPQNIWNPEGMHSIEILPNGRLQFAIRGLGSFLIDRTTLNGSLLPLNTWHHVMAVMKVDQALPEGGDPTSDELRVHYGLYVDGVLYDAGTNEGGLPVNPLPPGAIGVNLNDPVVTGQGLTLEGSVNDEHGVGWNEFGPPPGTNSTHFAGQLALTRLSLGALTVEQSLFKSVLVEGDYSGNGVVDAADYTVWRNNLNMMGGATVSHGDGTGDGNVTQEDYQYWKVRFGGGSGGGGLSSSGVPEPATGFLVLLSLSCVAPSCRCRFRSRQVR